MADGPRNLITPDGLARLRDEFHHLLRDERPKVVETVSWAAGNGDRSENGDYIYGKKRLREIDRRLRFLKKQIETAEPVDPATPRDPETVYFGATVLYADNADRERRVTIVGHVEADLEAGTISWRSPVGRALLGKRLGSVVTVQTPAGEDDLEILGISYPQAAAE